MFRDMLPSQEPNDHNRRNTTLSLRARQTNQILDSVPIRNSLRTSLSPVESPVLGGTNGHSEYQPSLLQQDESLRSCSPTPSDLEALEDSFYDLEIQPSLSPTDAADTEFCNSASQGTSSADCVQDGATQSPISSLSRSISIEDLDVHTAKSLQDRLCLVWRELTMNKHQYILTCTYRFARGPFLTVR